MQGFTDFDAAEYIQDEEDVFYTLQVAVEDDPRDGSLILSALNNIARSKGIKKLTKDKGLSPESLDEALSSIDSLDLVTMQKLLKSFGFGLTVRKLPS